MWIEVQLHSFLTVTLCRGEVKLKPGFLFRPRSGSQLITEQETGWVSELAVACLHLKHRRCLTWRLDPQRH